MNNLNQTIEAILALNGDCEILVSGHELDPLAAVPIHIRASDLQAIATRLKAVEAALTRLRDCDWVISLPDRMDAVREIAREALADKDETK